MKTFRTTAQFAILVTLSSQAQADWTANPGFASEYYYRGIFQDTSKTKGPHKGALCVLARPERLTRIARERFSGLRPAYGVQNANAFCRTTARFVVGSLNRNLL